MDENEIGVIVLVDEGSPLGPVEGPDLDINAIV